MRDKQCVRFLQWALPQLHLRWPGFRKVRGQVCKRLGRRLRDLGLADTDEYRKYLEVHTDEWQRVDAMCRITISRFYRDKGVFTALTQQVLPALLKAAHERGDSRLRIWSAGCGSGEEPYTLSILLRCEVRSQFPGAAFDIVATDADSDMIHRARDARYEFGSLKDLPECWRDAAFDHENGAYRLKSEYRHDVRFLEEDIRRTRLEGLFDLVLCRNLVFTYFDHALQIDSLRQIAASMRPGAALVLGVHERLPIHTEGLSTWVDGRRIYRRTGDA